MAQKRDLFNRLVLGSKEMYFIKDEPNTHLSGASYLLCSFYWAPDMCSSKKRSVNKSVPAAIIKIQTIRNKTAAGRY
jgi:hypothetical protein